MTKNETTSWGTYPYQLSRLRREPLPFTTINLIQSEERRVHVNHASYPRFSRGWAFFSRPQMHRETLELRNSSECPLKFSEIVENSWIIFGNSDTPQDKYLTPLSQKTLTGIRTKKLRYRYKILEPIFSN